MDPILEIAALKKYYGKEPNLTRALDGISFQVMPGEFLGIMGSSGSGKSTLLNCIATVIAPTAGAVALHGKCVTTLHGKALADYRGKEIGYLFQNFELIDNLTGRENILLPLSLHGVPETESRARLQKLADYLEVTDVLDKFPAQMSGGQKQRIAAARTHPRPRDCAGGRTDRRARLEKRPRAHGKALRSERGRRHDHPHGDARLQRRELLQAHPLHSGRCALPRAAARCAG